MADNFFPPEGRDSYEISQEDISGKKKKKRDRAWKTLITIIVFAVVIVFVALILTVFFVPEFSTLGDLFDYISSQYPQT